MFCHRHGDQRVCGATTVVVGQDFVTVEGQLWSVDMDPDSHGAGDIHTSHSWLTINGKGIITVNDHADMDDLCPIAGPPHCDPFSVGFSDLVDVN